MTIDEKYPNIANWIADSCIEIGSCDSGYSNVAARAMDAGGTAWETDEVFPTLEAVLDALKRGIAEWHGE